MKSNNSGSGLPWKLLAFSIFIFLLSILSYFALIFGYSPYLNNQIAKTDQDTKDLTRNISIDAQNKFVDVYSRLSNFKNLLANHIYSSNIFPLLERITYPTIYYNNVELNTDDKTLILSGIAADFNSLSSQLQAFDKETTSKNPLIDSYILNQSRAVQNQVNFRVTLNLSSKIFQK
jgi:hypothetical protein